MSQISFGRAKSGHHRCPASPKIFPEALLGRGGAAEDRLVVNTSRDAAALGECTTVDIVKQMVRLAELRESGALTDDQFAIAKAQLLGLPTTQSTSPTLATGRGRAPRLVALAAVAALVVGGVALYAASDDDPSAWQAPETPHLRA